MATPFAPAPRPFVLTLACAFAAWCGGVGIGIAIVTYDTARPDALVILAAFTFAMAAITISCLSAVKGH